MWDTSIYKCGQMWMHQPTIGKFFAAFLSVYFLNSVDMAFLHGYNTSMCNDYTF